MTYKNKKPPMEPSANICPNTYPLESYDIPLSIDEGAGGQVYVCQNRYTNKKLAIKSINTLKNLNILELTVMGTFRHPYLNHSDTYHIGLDETWIIQEMAENNLSHIEILKLDKDLIRSWIINLCQAVQCLHENNIVHCDIKPANVLCYADQSIKLTDFGSCVYSVERSQLFNHTTGTHNYRPIEMSKRGRERFSGWDSKVDIWALGCTIYYMLFGQDLFPRQTSGLTNTADKRKNMEHKMVNCLLDWKLISKENTKLPRYYNDLSYHEFHLAKGWKHSPYQSILLKMLKLNPYDRVDVEQVLSFFECIHKIDYKIRVNLSSPLTYQEVLAFSSYKKDKAICDLAMKIYSTYKYDKIDPLLENVLQPIINITQYVMREKHIKHLTQIEIDILNYLGCRL